MRERDRIERQVFERQHAAEEQAKEERRLAPVRKAEAELSKTAGKLLKAERETALNGREDPAFVRSLLSEPMKTIRLNSLEEANEHNLRSAHAFMSATPEYYQSQANAELIANWCTRNEVVVFDAETIGNIVRYLDSLGLMKHAPEPQPELVIESEPLPAPRQPEEFAGIDPLTGQAKVFTRYEVEKMDSETYRRAFRVPSKWQAQYEEQTALQAEYEKQRANQW